MVTCCGYFFSIYGNILSLPMFVLEHSYCTTLMLHVRVAVVVTVVSITADSMVGPLFDVTE